METISRSLQDWRDALWSAFVRLDSKSDDLGFYGNVIPRFPDSSLLTEVSSTNQTTERTHQHIRTDPSEWLLVAIQLDGCGHAEQSGTLAQTRPGSFTLYRTDQPYRLGFTGPFKQLVTHIPLAQIAARVPNLDNFTAKSFDTSNGAGSVFAELVMTLSKSAQVLGGAAAENYNRTLVELLSSTLQLLSDAPEDGLDRRFQTLTRELTAHLHDPDFDLTTFASARNQSVRSIQRVFQAQGATPLKWLLDQRLDAAAQELARRPLPGKVQKSVTEICFDWGFRDLSHFSNAFSQKFGRSPKAWRKMHRE